MEHNRGKKSLPKQLLNMQGNVGTSPTFKVILLLIAAGAITTAIIIATTVVSSNNKSISEAYCQEIASKSTDAFAKQACKLYNCPFDISACTLPCPFGYSEGLDGCPNACTCASESKSFQLDIVLEENDIPHMLETYGYLKNDESDFTLQRSGALRTPLWNNNEIDGRFQVAFDYDMKVKFPYSQKQISSMEIMLKKLSGLVCIDFKRRTTEKYYMSFTSDQNCRSSVGRVYKRQSVWIDSRGCVSEVYFLHEVLHALGFIHEHCRPDRDLYIKVFFENTNPGLIYAYDKIKNEEVIDLGVNYNHQSIMHYGPLEFSINGKPSMVDLKTGKPFRVGEKVNVSDQLNVIRRYKCKGIKEPVAAGAIKWKEWGQWAGACTETCEIKKITRRRQCDSTQKKCADLLEKNDPRASWVEEKPCFSTCYPQGLICSKTCGHGTQYKIYTKCGFDHKCHFDKTSTIQSCNKGKCPRTSRPEGNSGGKAGGAGNQKKGGFNEQKTIRPVYTTRLTLPTIRPTTRLTPPPTIRPTTHLTPPPTIRPTTRLTPPPTIRPTTRLTPPPTIRPTTRLTPSPTIRPTTPSTFVGKIVPECKTGNEEPRSKFVWAPWSPWTGCPNCAKTGTGQRTRECIGGKVQECLFAYYLRGDAGSEKRSCSELKCAPQPSDGWSEWTDCPTKCGGGRKTRTKKCDVPNCLLYNSAICNEQPCTDRDYHWEEWSSWWGCDVCEVEKIVWRRRSCVGGYPGDCRRSAQQCDKSIHDLTLQYKPCNKLVCKDIITHQWSEWGSWHRCSKSCGGGHRMKYRTCSGGKFGCGHQLGFGFNICNTSPCRARTKQWSSWTIVGDCSATCGIGWVVKVRRCLHASNTCPGKSVDTRDCNNNQIPCPKAQTDNQANSTGPLGMFNKIAITVPNYFCNDSNNAVWTFGYLNSDKRFDLICKRDTNLEASYSRISTIFENIDWRQDLSKCTQGDIYLADFNGDIQDDFVCQNKRTKILTINLWANERFSSNPLYEGEFCTGEDDRVMFLDANGDRKNDVLCDHGRFNGYAILNLYDAT